MNYSELELPSNRRFGLFSLSVLGLGATYFYLQGANLFATILVGGSVGIGLITALRDGLLIWPNRAWMKLGYYLGRVISPIVIGILFFLIVTPVALVTRVFGRDELGLKRSSLKTYWKRKDDHTGKGNFRQQF